MRVWTDAQLSPKVAAWIREALAEDAIAVRDLGLAASSDTNIFASARHTYAVGLTKDRDFVELLERLGPPPKVVWLTCGNTSNEYLRGLPTRAWPHARRMLDAGEALIEISGPPPEAPRGTTRSTR